jgi:aryl-alcohol dehydrogenase-like predicted oxidoreductase|mmetsp:Transcript_15767/g.34053  ORF Transcript_15767/g.34053 Transcript_15767/m.34053 type:complete len:333 (+) Transcript_15767:105-1103(+)
MKMPPPSQLPNLGLGMAALGRPGYINLGRDAIFGNSSSRPIEAMQSQADLVLDSLFANTSKGSVPWVDCARSYGLSEQFVGDYLKRNNIKPNEVYCSSKWGYTYVADWNVSLDRGAPHEVKDHSVSNFLKQVEETKHFIGHYVDLYQIHSATFESGVMDDADIHKALHQCRENLGWKIGLSVSSPKQDEVMRRAMEIEVDGHKLFDSVQCTYNVLEQRPAPALLAAHKAGMDIIIKEGLANGRVLRNIIILKYAKEMDCTPDSLALGCILAQPFQPRVLSGAVTPEQLHSNMKAEGVAERLRKDATLLDKIMAECVMDSEKYWKDRAALAWN